MLNGWGCIDYITFAVSKEREAILGTLAAMFCASLKVFPAVCGNLLSSCLTFLDHPIQGLIDLRIAISIIRAEKIKALPD